MINGAMHSNNTMNWLWRTYMYSMSDWLSLLLIPTRTHKPLPIALTNSLSTRIEDQYMDLSLPNLFLAISQNLGWFQYQMSFLTLQKHQCKSEEGDCFQLATNGLKKKYPISKFSKMKGMVIWVWNKSQIINDFKSISINTDLQCVFSHSKHTWEYMQHVADYSLQCFIPNIGNSYNQ